MAHVLILGGGFAGVVAAEQLARELDARHTLTLVSRNRLFVFYPALVRLAFGRSAPADISFDLREALLARRVRFLSAEVARVDLEARQVTFAGGEMSGDLSYDYLVFALGRRLATERITGFYEHAHHLLTLEAAARFGVAVRDFHEGRALIGSCQGARLPVPVYETAFALSRLLEGRGERERVRIRVVSPEPPGDHLGGVAMARALRSALDAHEIEFMPDFVASRVTAHRVETADGLGLSYNLLMLIPPFVGHPSLTGTGVTDDDGYVLVDRALRVSGVERAYAAGDCLSLPGPKMGHMAVRQGAVVAANLAAEIEGREPTATYDHEMMLVIDEGGRDSIYLRQALDGEVGPAAIGRGRFWSWAKWVQEKYWQHRHS